MTITTLMPPTDPQKATAGMAVAAGFVYLGSHVDMTQAEIEQAKLQGLAFLVGPARSPGPPPAGMAVAAGIAGAPVGAYKYVVTFVTAIGETPASPEVLITLTSQHGAITAIPVGAPGAGVISRKIYRTAAGGASGTEKLLTTIADNVTTTFDDNVADGTLGATVGTADTSSNAIAVGTALNAFAWAKPSAADTSINA